MRKDQKFWTEEEEWELRKLWIGGFSASQISKSLNCGYSRNAVIGKIHRLNLPPRIDIPRLGRPRGEQKPRIERILGMSGPRKLKQVPFSDDASDLKIPVEQRRATLELDSKCCHWPVGDPRKPDFFFCGAPKARKVPYCPTHLYRAIHA